MELIVATAITRAYRICRIFIGILLLVILGSISIHLALPLPRDIETNQRDVIAQLNFLKDALQRGAGEQMQSLFPEGFFFTHVLYGLTWVNVAIASPNDESLRTRAVTEARWALAAMESETGRAPFVASLTPPYGVFYTGWSNYLHAGILRLTQSVGFDPRERNEFEQRSILLAEAFKNSHSPFLPSYPGNTWPVDSFPAIASLRLYDYLLKPRFQPFLMTWLERALTQRNLSTGLIPHHLGNESRHPDNQSRGTSQTLILYFFRDLDPGLATEHYLRFREQFVAQRFYIPAILEYPLGTQGHGDIDSGPLIAGVSLSASTVAIAASRMYGDTELEVALTRNVEAFGLPIQLGSSRRYGFGLLPIGDAFYVWARTARSWTSDQRELAAYPTLFSRWLFTPAILIALGCLSGIFWVLVSDVRILLRVNAS